MPRPGQPVKEQSAKIGERRKTGGFGILVDEGFALAPIALPVAKTCRLWLPLERLRRQTGKTSLPRRGSLAEFPNPPLHSAFCAIRSPALSPTRADGPNASVPLTALEIHKRAGNPDNARPAWLMPTLEPGINHASRAAPR